MESLQLSAPKVRNTRNSVIPGFKIVVKNYLNTYGYVLLVLTSPAIQCKLAAVFVSIAHSSDGFIKSKTENITNDKFLATALLLPSCVSRLAACAQTRSLFAVNTLKGL